MNKRSAKCIGPMTMLYDRR